MELFKHREECCGCSACYAVCCDLSGATTMVPDEEGFLYPVVDDEVCIRCYRCILVCPFKDIDPETVLEENGDWSAKYGKKNGCKTERDAERGILSSEKQY